MMKTRKLMIEKKTNINSKNKQNQSLLKRHQSWKQGNQWLLEKILMLITSKLLIYKDKHQN